MANSDEFFQLILSDGFRRMFPNRVVGIVFSLTNESLEAVMAGLEPTSKDCVLSVAGCGDQAFAILEKAGKVVVCDTNEAQLELVRRRKAAVEGEAYEGFFNATGTDYEHLYNYYRIEYFTLERLLSIRRKLQNLEIAVRGGIEDFAGKGTFTKIYASNAISGYGRDGLEEQLAHVASALQEGGLLYVSNGAEIEALVPNISKLGLLLVQRLTGLARGAEKDLWTPNVYQKK